MTSIFNDPSRQLLLGVRGANGDFVKLNQHDHRVHPNSSLNILVLINSVLTKAMLHKVIEKMLVRQR